MKCPKCNADLIENADTCPNCNFDIQLYNITYSRILQKKYNYWMPQKTLKSKIRHKILLLHLYLTTKYIDHVVLTVIVRT